MAIYSWFTHITWWCSIVMEQFTRGYWKMLENESYAGWFENVWRCWNCRHRFGKRPDQGHTMKKLLVEYLKPPTSSAIYYHMLDDFGYVLRLLGICFAHQKISQSIYPIIISHIILYYIYIVYMNVHIIHIYIYTYMYIYIYVYPIEVAAKIPYIYIYPLKFDRPWLSDRLLQLRHLAWLSSGQPVSHPFLGASEFTLSLCIHRYRCSMYGIFQYLPTTCPKNHPNVSKHSRHGASGIDTNRFWYCWWRMLMQDFWTAQNFIM